MNLNLNYETCTHLTRKVQLKMLIFSKTVNVDTVLFLLASFGLLYVRIKER